MATDNDDKKDDDDTNSKDVEVVEIGTGEALTMLDRLVNLKDLSKEETNSLAFLTDKLEKIRVLNKKQSHINDYSSFYDRFYWLIFNTSGWSNLTSFLSFFSLSKVTPMSSTYLDYLK